MASAREAHDYIEKYFEERPQLIPPQRNMLDEYIIPHNLLSVIRSLLEENRRLTALCAKD